MWGKGVQFPGIVLEGSTTMSGGYFDRPWDSAPKAQEHGIYTDMGVLPAQSE